jgi:hypothetical protein
MAIASRMLASLKVLFSLELHFTPTRHRQRASRRFETASVRLAQWHHPISAGISSLSKAIPNPWGAKGAPDHQDKVKEEAETARAEAKAGETDSHRLLIITAALSQVKSPYAFSAVAPNRIMQSLIAVLAGMGVPLLCTETHEMAEEVEASYLYQIHLYHWLEANDFGRFLSDNDL